MSNTFRILMMMGLLQISQSYAHSLSNQMFEVKGGILFGWVTLSFQRNGEYIYQENVKDNRTSLPAILTGSVKRVSFDIYSPQELDLFRFEEELKLKKEQLNNLLEVQEHKIRKQRRLQALDWPRYKYENGSYCVPEVKFSKNADWIEHLTCIPLVFGPKSEDSN